MLITEVEVRKEVTAYSKKREQGLCVYYTCTDSPVAGKVFCKVHAAAHAMIDKARYDKRQNEGLCPTCGDRKPATDKKLCMPCLESKQHAHESGQQAAGVDNVVNHDICRMHIASLA